MGALQGPANGLQATTYARDQIMQTNQINPLEGKQYLIESKAILAAQKAFGDKWNIGYQVVPVANEKGRKMFRVLTSVETVNNAVEHGSDSLAWPFPKHDGVVAQAYREQIAPVAPTVAKPLFDFIDQTAALAAAARLGGGVVHKCHDDDDKDDIEIVKPAKKASTRVPSTRQEANGVKRPIADGKCKAVWDYCDTMVAHSEMDLLTAKKVKADAVTFGWNPNNALIEFYQWRKFNGIEGRVLKSK